MGLSIKPMRQAILAHNGPQPISSEKTALVPAHQSARHSLRNAPPKPKLPILFSRSISCHLSFTTLQASGPARQAQRLGGENRYAHWHPLGPSAERRGNHDARPSRPHPAHRPAAPPAAPLPIFCGAKREAKRPARARERLDHPDYSAG